VDEKFDPIMTCQPLVHASDVAAMPIRQRLQDPGSVKLIVRVRNIDAAFAPVVFR
jgi:hypothetical protein